MVRPLKILADQFALKNSINITIRQGASGFLYQTLKKEKRGDLYFPGASSYRTEHAKEGFLKEYAFLGYNRIAMIVPKGNPKNLTNDLMQLGESTLSVVLVSPNSGSIGKASYELLETLGLTRMVYENTTYFTTDSYRLSKAVLNGHADLVLNWEATARWPESEGKLDVIPIDTQWLEPQRLEINLLSFSDNPELAKSFMRYLSSEHGLQIFHRYGFLTQAELQEAVKTASTLYVAENL